MNEEQRNVVNLSLRQVEHQNFTSLVLGNFRLMNLGIQHLTKQVAHEMLVGRTNGIGQPQHAHLGQEGQTHAHHGRLKPQPRHTVVHGFTEQALVVRHHRHLELLLRHQLSRCFICRWRRLDSVEQVCFGHGCDL